MDYDADLLIIGGGAAGLTVAAGAARLGARVVLADRGPTLGGDCLHHGCVPSKTLIASARARRTMRDAPRFGLPEVALPPVDFKAVASHIAGVQSVIQKHDSVERFSGLGVEVRFGDAVFVDEHTVAVEGRRISARRIVVATGSSPQIPAFPGLADTPYLTNRDIFTLETLPASLIVLGGGPIAVEMAQAFARLGSRVVLVQRGGHILSREDADMAAVVHEALEQDGVRIMTGATVEVVRRQDAGVVVTVRVGDEHVDVHGERLLVALGRTPNVEGLHLGNAGVVFSERGVPVDARMRTSQSHILAAGDVTGAWQFTHAAGYEGSVVVANAVLRLPRKAKYDRMPWCTFTDPELASVGLNEREAHRQGIGVDVHTESFSSNDRALAEGTACGLLKLVLARGTQRVLGVQIAGPHAGELINGWCMALGGGVRLTTLAGGVMPYPTLGEISRRVAGNIVSEALFSDKVRNVLCTLFRYRGKGC